MMRRCKAAAWLGSDMVSVAMAQSTAGTLDNLKMPNGLEGEGVPGSLVP